MRKEIEYFLLDIYQALGMDRPSNHQDLIEFCLEDVQQCAGEDWHSGDVVIAFRRFIESKP